MQFVLFTWPHFFTRVLDAVSICTDPKHFTALKRSLQACRLFLIFKFMFHWVELLFYCTRASVHSLHMNILQWVRNLRRQARWLSSPSSTWIVIGLSPGCIVDNAQKYRITGGIEITKRRQILFVINRIKNKKKSAGGSSLRWPSRCIASRSALQDIQLLPPTMNQPNLYLAAEYSKSQVLCWGNSAEGLRLSF